MVQIQVEQQDQAKGPYSSGVSLMLRLRLETQEQHYALEVLPFNRLLLEGELSLTDYATLLRVYLEIWGMLEDALVLGKNGLFASVWDSGMSKCRALLCDIGYLEKMGHYAGEVGEAALSLLRTLEAWSLRGSLALLGGLYVMEGSTLGGQVIKRRLRLAYGLEEDGLCYYGSYGAKTGSHWGIFKKRMDALCLSSAEADEVVEGANVVFIGLIGVMRAILAA